MAGIIHVVVSSAIRYGRMPEAERKKLVAGLLAEESVGKPGCSDLKSLAKQVNSAYLKNLSMTKKRARSILAGKTSSTSVRHDAISLFYTKAPGPLSRLRVLLVSALCHLRRGHPLEGRERPRVEPVSSRCPPHQGDRGARFLPLPVHHGGDGTGADGVCQVYPGLCGPLSERPGESQPP